MKRLKRLALLALCATLPAAALAQGTPPGGPPPGGAGGPPPGAGSPPNGSVQSAMAAVKDTPQETANKQTVEAWGALLDQGMIDEAFQKYVSRNFVDHSEMARAMAKTRNLGYTRVLAIFKVFLAQPSSQKIVQKISADDDMVTVQGRLGQDIYRVRNGKITDHWDTLGGFAGPNNGAPS